MKFLFYCPRMYLYIRHRYYYIHFGYNDIYFVGCFMYYDILGENTLDRDKVWAQPSSLQNIIFVIIKLFLHRRELELSLIFKTWIHNLGCHQLRLSCATQQTDASAKKTRWRENRKIIFFHCSRIKSRSTSKYYRADVYREGFDESRAFAFFDLKKQKKIKGTSKIIINESTYNCFI
jgi:hypothetical protein